MAYVKQDWVDRPSKTTPINAARLNHMEEGIFAISENFDENGINFGRKADTKSGMRSTSEGFNTTASDTYAHAEGYQSVASSISSHAEGYNTEASGYYAHAEGYQTKATEQGAHAEGYITEATGSDGSHAEGYLSKASGLCSHAEGNETVSSGAYSHAEGYKSKAQGGNAHAEGQKTTASADYSHSEGEETVASGYVSHAEGRGTIAKGEYQHVQGKYNIEDTQNQYAHIVGGGTGDTDRKNIHTLDWNGNAVFSGDVTNGNGVSMDYLKSQIESSGNDLYTSTGINFGRKDGTTNGNRSSALGEGNEASGSYSYGKYLFIIGSGTSDTDRKNAMTLDSSGNGTFDGNVICKNQDGSQISMVGMKSQMDGQYSSLSGGLTSISQALSALTERVAALEGNTGTT